ncbi:MAG TPA: GrpB family protein [Pyrinomonadaceae bacterium]
MYGMRKDELCLLPHDPSWGDDFLSEKARIAHALGDHSTRIEHVGSTAIPAVHAKPILDIAILCGEKGLESVARTLRLLGYDYRGQFDSEVGHYYAVLDRGDIRLCQAHIFTEATADWYSKLRFRDVLRQNLGLAREYDDYKLGLAKVAANKTEYAEIKSRWVDAFVLKVMSAPLTPDNSLSSTPRQHGFHRALIPSHVGCLRSTPVNSVVRR